MTDFGLVQNVAGESTSNIVTLDGDTAKDYIERKNIDKANDMIEAYQEKLQAHEENINKALDKLGNNLEEIEIMPLGTYILVKQFENNPFQKIVRDSKTGLILDTGGMAPQYKNTDNGQIEEESPFIYVGVVQEVGPECRYLKAGDAVFYPKNACIPVPFFKQGLVQINETRVLAVVNEGLTDRFNEIKNNK